MLRRSGRGPMSSKRRCRCDRSRPSTTSAWTLQQNTRQRVAGLVLFLKIVALGAFTVPPPMSKPKSAGYYVNNKVEIQAASKPSDLHDLSSLQANGLTEGVVRNQTRIARIERRPVDFPPFVAETVDLDESTSQINLTIRQENDGRTVVSRAHVEQLAPPQKPWWFGISDGINVEFGPIQILKRTTEETRLRNDRSYARKTSFQKDRLREPPGLYDLSTPQCSPKESFWISIPARFFSFGVAYFFFPFATKFVDSFVTMPPNRLEEITAQFGPGISVLYGTFISLTLSILYHRQRAIQENVSLECSYLTLMTRRIITLVDKTSPELALAAAQAVADQIRALVQSSRGKELLVLMYSDPYARLGQVLDDYEEVENRYCGRVSQCRDILKDLYRSRANRLSDESLALPPTHFFILNFLTALMLLGFTADIIPTVDQVSGAPSNESCLLFALLSTIYLLFYNFATDLNGPFQGVYQIRRSTAAAHLLQMRWFLANHPMLLGKVDFDEPEIDPEAAGYRVVSPDLGEFWFEES